MSGVSFFHTDAFRIGTKFEYSKNGESCDLWVSKLDYDELQERFDTLKAWYEDRGAAMRKAGDTVRSLYVGSEVSKRILALREECDRLRSALEEVRAVMRDHSKPAGIALCVVREILEAINKKEALCSDNEPRKKE